MKKLYMLLVAVLLMVITGCSSSTDPHTVTYDANGGTGSVPTDSNTYLPTFTVTVLENIDITNAGYTFTCWNTQADGNGTDRAPASTFAIGSANVILYAKWTAPANDGKDYTSANIGTLKYVPAGSFQRDARSTNISTVTTAFRMSEKEITRAQFYAVMGTDPSNTTCSTWTSDPVQMTNWYHAIAFCNKLSIAEGLTQVYRVIGINFTTLTYAGIPTTANTTWDAATANWSANGYRLPTEMEWMWAAMGATSDRSNSYTGTGTNTTGYTKGYAGSIEAGGTQVNIGYYAWTNENSTSTTHPVGTKLANELGIYDMSGNVWEWCWDWYALSYTTGTLTDDKGAASGTDRVIRGGSWLYHASYATVAYRDYGNPLNQHYILGLRVVRP